MENRRQGSRLVLLLLALHILGILLFLVGVFACSDRSIHELSGDEEWAATPHDVRPNPIAGLFCGVALAACAAGAIVAGRRFKSLNDNLNPNPTKNFWYYYERPIVFEGDLLCFLALVVFYFAISTLLFEHPYWPDPRVLLGVGILIVIAWSIRIRAKQ